jgi:transcriptional regulator with XRE-family HTH domain
MITPIQTIKARRVTRMTEADLSAASGVSQNAIEEFEAAKRSLNATTVQALRAALKRAGWEAGSDSLSTRTRGITIDPREQGFGDQLEQRRNDRDPRDAPGSVASISRSIAPLKVTAMSSSTAGSAPGWASDGYAR